MAKDTHMTTIKLRNSMSRQKEVFAPIDPNNVRMYLCGPTVYDRAHIGNARNVIMFDVLFRLLRQVYGADHVTYVRNFTDVDDKINARAASSGRDISDITAEKCSGIWMTWVRLAICCHRICHVRRNISIRWLR